MNRKLIIKFFFLIASLLLILSANKLSAESIYIDMHIVVYPDLKTDFESNFYLTSRLKKNIDNRIQKEFINNSITLAKNEVDCEFVLRGTIFVKHFIKNLDSFSIVFYVENLKINHKAGLYPPILFNNFSSRDLTGGVSSREELVEAINLSLDDLIKVISSNGVFYFPKHPIFSAITKIDEVNLTNISSEDLKLIIDKIVEDLRKSLSIYSNSELFRQKEYFQNNNLEKLSEILKYFDNLKKQYSTISKDIKSIKTLVSQINYIHTSSIIINVNCPKEGFNSNRIKAIIKPESPCNDCDLKQIEADNLGLIQDKIEFNRFKQNARYLFPYYITGKIIGKENGTFLINLKTNDYKKVLEINMNCSLPQGKIINSIEDINEQYPRILVRVTD